MQWDSLWNPEFHHSDPPWSDLQFVRTDSHRFVNELSVNIKFPSALENDEKVENWFEKVMGVEGIAEELVKKEKKK